LDDLYYFIFSSNYPNEKFIKNNIKKLTTYRKHSGFLTEFPIRIIFNNQNIADDLIEFSIDYYINNQFCGIDEIVNELYLYREKLSKNLKEKFKKLIVS